MIGNSSEFVCTSCGSVGSPKRVTPGSFLIEILLWICFFVPGIIYSIWRVSAKYDACRACGQRSVVPISTPIGEQVAAKSLGASRAHEIATKPGWFEMFGLWFGSKIRGLFAK